VIKMKDILFEDEKSVRRSVDTAGIILKSEWGVILCKDSDKWGIPKGKVELGETPIQAAIRETAEEVSILVSENGSHINTPIKIKAVKKNSIGKDFHIFECRLNMHILPTKSLEHEEVRYFTELPDDIDPRLKELI